MKKLIFTLLLLFTANSAFSSVILNGQNSSSLELEVIQVDFQKDSVILFTNSFGFNRLKFLSRDIKESFNLSLVEFSKLITENNGQTGTALHISIDLKLTSEMEKIAVLKSLKLVL